MEKILVAEDDKSIREELITLLKNNGYCPVNEPPCDLALLDVNMPGESGFEMCRKIKQTSSVPVIFLTCRDSAEDEILGFGVGGDDYIKKPYNSAVLLARISRLLRKSNSVFSVRGLALDCAALMLQYNAKTIDLTKNEMRIMYFLMQKPVCTKEEIIENLWVNSCYIDENTLYVNVKRIREKLKELGADGFLKTVRGVGYRL